MNVYDYLMAHAQPDHLAVISDRCQTTYADLLTQIEAIGSALQKLGIQTGQPVGILAENSAFWISSYLAILMLGAVAVPLPTRRPPAVLQSLSSTIGFTVVCAAENLFRRYKRAFNPEMGAVLDREGQLQLTSPFSNASPSVDSEHGLGFGIELDPQRGNCSVADVRDQEDLAALMFTSGSTGQPNAVRISHRNIIANTESILSYIDIDSDARMMVVLPFEYCFGASLLHTHLRVGGTLVLNNQFQFAEDMLKMLEQHSCTAIAGVPSIFQHLLRRSSFPKRQWPCLRQVQQAGGALSPVFIDELRQTLPQARVYVMYGQTEATARLSYLPPELLDTKRGSIGKGLPGVTLRVVKPDGQDVTPGEEGEIVAQGENIGLGYWQNDGSNKFREGQLFTGDIAKVDEDGFIYIVGRDSDFVKPLGHRISCREIEDILCEVPNIVETAVIGIPDPIMTEAIHAFIVPTNGAELTESLVKASCRGRLAPYVMPKWITFLPQLPKNESGKVMKNELRGMASKLTTPG